MKRKLSLMLLLFLLLTLAIPVAAGASAAEGLSYVTDSAGLLTEEQRAELENTAATLSERYQCGVYIVTVDDYRSFNQGSIQNCSEGIFDQFQLGFGETRDGILILLSMAERDFDMDVHGSFGNYAFSSGNRDRLVDAFRDYFRSDDWYGGFRSYLSAAEGMLRYGRETYEDYLKSLGPSLSPVKVAIAAAVGCLSGAGVCGGFKRQMKTAQERRTAEEYVLPGNPVLRIKQDRFLNATRHVEIIQESRSSLDGGGGGFSGHSHTSGKF